MELCQAQDCSPVDTLSHLPRIYVSPRACGEARGRGHTKLRRNPGNEYLTGAVSLGDTVQGLVDLQDRYKDQSQSEAPNIRGQESISFILERFPGHYLIAGETRSLHTTRGSWRYTTVIVGT